MCMYTADSDCGGVVRLRSDKKKKKSLINYHFPLGQSKDGLHANGLFDLAAVRKREGKAERTVRRIRVVESEPNGGHDTRPVRRLPPSAARGYRASEQGPLRLSRQVIQPPRPMEATEEQPPWHVGRPCEDPERAFGAGPAGRCAGLVEGGRWPLR